MALTDQYFFTLFENLFKPHQLLLSTTSKKCFELTSSVLSTISKLYIKMKREQEK
ncbi:hypothetical protein PNI0212_01994 [Streptococcus pneumoniae PNI0212]|nr:hypothetical protein PNI0212_01994 [Streptococcus pneumoniae PNI0212]